LAIGKAGGTMDVVSLGDKGEAVLSFDEPIKNGDRGILLFSRMDLCKHRQSLRHFWSWHL